MNSLQEEIVLLINDINPYEDVDANTLLIKSGILSSLEIFVLIGAIESKFQITVTDEHVVLENFLSVDAIEKMIAKIKG